MNNDKMNLKLSNWILAAIFSVSVSQMAVADSVLQSALATQSVGKGTDGGAEKGKYDEALEQGLRARTKSMIDPFLKKKTEGDAEFLKKKIESGSVKKEILELVQDPHFIESIQDTEAKSLLNKMLSNGLVEDIQNTKYVIQDHCFDDAGIEKFLSTKNGIMFSPICVSPAKFYQVYNSQDLFKLDGLTGREKVVQARTFHKYPFWQIAGMFLHDHARHFSEIIKDSHNFAAKMSVAIYLFPRLHLIANDREILRYEESVLGSDYQRNSNPGNFLFLSGNFSKSDIKITIEVSAESECGQTAASKRILDIFDGSYKYIPYSNRISLVNSIFGSSTVQSSYLDKIRQSDRWQHRVSIACVTPTATNGAQGFWNTHISGTNEQVIRWLESGKGAKIKIEKTDSGQILVDQELPNYLGQPNNSIQIIYLNEVYNIYGHKKFEDK